MINNVTLKGRIGRDPEILTTQKGTKIAKFSLATSTVSRDENGEWHQQIYWHTIIVSTESTMGWIQEVLKRGELVRVEGKLTYHYWKDKFGQCRRTPQISVSDQGGKVELADKNMPIGSQNHSKKANLEKIDSENIPFLAHQPNQSIHQSQHQGEKI